MYCGDGINDLEALAAADVGMAVGAADASAAATFSYKHYSVAGQLPSLTFQILDEGLVMHQPMPALFLHQEDTKLCRVPRTEYLHMGHTLYPLLV